MMGEPNIADQCWITRPDPASCVTPPLARPDPASCDSPTGSTRPRTPRITGAALHRVAPVVADRRNKTVGTHQPKLSGLNTVKVGFTRYLCTSPAFVATHRLVCYQPRRKAQYWARGARLARRDAHPLEHASFPVRTVPALPASRHERTRVRARKKRPCHCAGLAKWWPFFFRPLFLPCGPDPI